MRTIEEFKQHQIDSLAGALTRPAMCCPTDFGANLYFSRVVSDLCWIDNTAEFLMARIAV
jgi:hypothetical protein